MEKTPDYIKNCPLSFDWVEYKGETFFGALNYERSLKAKRAMIDLSYCATKAMNEIVLKTVAWDAKKFNLNPEILN